jgi:hypothetical protein
MPPIATCEQMQQVAPLLDHRVGGGEQCRRNGEAERRCGLEIDDKLEFGRLFDGQVGWIGAFEDAIDITSRAPTARMLMRVRLVFMSGSTQT